MNETIEKHVLRVQALLNRIDYPNHRFLVLLPTTGCLVQIAYDEIDVDRLDGPPVEQHGRKFYISSHATDSEIIQTALLAARISSEHRVREHFLLDGVRLYGPHITIEAHKEAASQMEFRAPTKAK